MMMPVTVLVRMHVDLDKPQEAALRTLADIIENGIDRLWPWPSSPPWRIELDEASGIITLRR